MGETEVVCLVSTDDEAFTYNKRVNRLAIIQEHKMILKAIERGASEETDRKSTQHQCFEHQTETASAQRDLSGSGRTAQRQTHLHRMRFGN